MQIYTKETNIMQIYTKETAFLMEHKDAGGMETFLEGITELFETTSFSTELNKHVEGKIGELYTEALGYMDSERDCNTMKNILTKITSVNFMARLQNVKNRSAYRNCLHVVPQHLTQFRRLREDIKVALEKWDLSQRQRKYLLRRTMQMKKMRAIRVRNSTRSGQKLKVEEFPDLVSILEYEFGEPPRHVEEEEWKATQNCGPKYCTGLPATKPKWLMLGKQ